MLPLNISNRGLDVLVQTDITGEKLSWYGSIRGVYLIPAVILAFLGLIALVGLLAELVHKLSSLRKEISLAEKRRDSAREEAKVASSALTQLRLKLDERERDAVDKALLAMSEGHLSDRKFDEQSRRKLWTILRSEVDKK